MTISYLNTHPQAWLVGIAINAMPDVKIWHKNPVIEIHTNNERTIERIKEKLKQNGISYKLGD